MIVQPNEAHSTVRVNETSRCSASRLLAVSGKPGAIVQSDCYTDHLLDTGDGPYLIRRA